jgi:hypothetical protein
MTPNRFMNFMALLLLAFNQDCRATTIVIAVASDGVVIASDSKQRSGSPSGLTGDPEPADKVVVLGDRVGVGVIGLANYRVGTKADFVEFHASEFLEEIKHSLASNPSVSLVEDAVIDKLKVAMDRLAPYVENGVIHKQSADEGDLIDFIVAGYDQGGRVAVRKIRVECDWAARKLSSPIVETNYPHPSVPLHSDFVFFGRTESIFQVQTVGSAERKAATERYPSILLGLQTFLSGGNFTTEKAVAIATDMIRLQSQFDPKM